MKTTKDEAPKKVFRAIAGMLDECGYKLSHERINQKRPAKDEGWYWAHWDKCVTSSSGHQTRMTVILLDGDLKIQCETSLPIKALPYVGIMSHACYISLPKVNQTNPDDLRAIEKYFEKWVEQISGVNVLFDTDT